MSLISSIPVVIDLSLKARERDCCCLINLKSTKMIRAIFFSVRDTFVLGVGEFSPLTRCHVF